MSEIEDEIVAARKRIRAAKAEVDQAKLQRADLNDLNDLKRDLEQLLDELENPGERYALFEPPARNGDSSDETPPARGHSRPRKRP